MTRKRAKDMTLKQIALVIAVALVGLYLNGFFAPLPEQDRTASTVFLYYGPEGETVTVQETAQEVSQSERDMAEAALTTADYFGAFAIGPQGQTGQWTAAQTPALARSYALALCGPDCRIVAERLPLYRDPARSEPVLTAAQAHNLGLKWPFRRAYLATGGAVAWGFHAASSGKAAWRSAMRDAATDCEVRRAAEPRPATLPATLSAAPCRVQALTDIVDLRPKPALYPAAFTVALTDLAPASTTRVHDHPDAPSAGLLGPYLPSRLHGARAANGASAFEVVAGAGWSEAGAAIALLKCNAERRPSEGPCVLTHRIQPDPAVPDGVLAVSPDLYADFLAWQKTEGAGAFAISPYGVWGYAQGFADLDAAI